MRQKIRCYWIEIIGLLTQAYEATSLTEWMLDDMAYLKEINNISYNVAMIMLHALHIATNKKPNGISPVGFLFVNVATIPTARKGI